MLYALPSNAYFFNIYTGDPYLKINNDKTVTDYEQEKFRLPMSLYKETRDNMEKETEKGGLQHRKFTGRSQLLRHFFLIVRNT